MFVVYELWNPLDNTCFYVGKGSAMRSRFNDHLRQAKRLREGLPLNDHNPLKSGTICKIQNAGFQPEYRIVLKTAVEKDALDLEVKLISQYGRRNCNTGILTNMTDGGEGIRGWKLTEEQREKRVGSMTGRKMSEDAKEKMRQAALGRKHSDETRKKLSEIQTGKQLSDEHKRNISLGNIGKTMSAESREKMSQSRLGKPLSEYQKQRMSEGRKGIPWSDARYKAQKKRSA